MSTDNPMIAFDCGECWGTGRNGQCHVEPCPHCFRGKIRITLDDLAERIARKINGASPTPSMQGTVAP